MEMCYDGALVMPNSYAVMDEEEMTYVEGGRKKIVITITRAAVVGAIGSYVLKKAGKWCAAKIGTALIANAPKIAAWFLGTGFVAQALIFTAAGILAASAIAFGITLAANKKVTIRI